MRRVPTFEASFWRRLAADRAGNVAYIAAASVVPMLALIGGGVDIGRAYMARTQLQSACDAGSLAGRRAMSASGEYGAAEKAKADMMFDLNFDAGAVRATGVTFETQANDEGQVSGTATATVPTAVMDFFGKDTFVLRTNCMAELQMANTDVMFVLDTTGSMSGTRITGLRDAVRDFHKTINEAVKDENTRVRYGFVPYSMAVNAKELVSSGALPVEYLVDSAPYETRLAYFNTPKYIPTTVNLGTTIQTYGELLTSTECNNYGVNKFPNSSGSNPETTGSPPNKVTTRTYAFHSRTGSGTRRTCNRTVTTTETTYVTKYGFTNWRYRQASLDSSNFKTGALVPVGTNIVTTTQSVIDPSVITYADSAGYYDMPTLAQLNGGQLRNVGVTNMTWSGCIEERDTVDSASWNPVPNGAFDLDLDLEPNSDQTRWRPMWEGVTYLRSNKGHEDSTAARSIAYSACPSPMKLFTEVELSNDPDDVPAWLETYISGLVPTGNTYHDIGMIWGGRLSSPRGIFADNVNLDDKPVSRHLIYMTDGQMEPFISGYNSYGIEAVTNRVAPLNSNTATVTARHTARFLAACRAVKAQGTTVWVVAFGTTLTADMRTCSSDGRAYFSSNSAELRQRFRFIASQVANLRLGE